MASDIVTIADAVTAALNAKLPDWGYSANAVRRNTPTYDLSELGTPRFTVVPISREVKLAGKGGSLVMTAPRIDIDIRYHTGNDQTTNDQLTELSEQIAEHFLGGVAGLTACLSAESSVVFQDDKMIEQGVFAVAVSLTFSIGRTPR